VRRAERGRAPLPTRVERNRHIDIYRRAIPQRLNNWTRMGRPPRRKGLDFTAQLRRTAVNRRSRRNLVCPSTACRSPYDGLPSPLLAGSTGDLSPYDGLPSPLLAGSTGDLSPYDGLPSPSLAGSTGGFPRTTDFPVRRSPARRTSFPVRRTSQSVARRLDGRLSPYDGLPSPSLAGSTGGRSSRPFAANACLSNTLPPASRRRFLVIALPNTVKTADWSLPDTGRRIYTWEGFFVRHPRGHP
jgi:hypothetical protein